jgi:Zn-dependent protease
MDLLILAPVLLISFVAHEYAHARVALHEGDDTAYRLGRVTLNPIPHIDLFGTILVPAMLIASGSGFLIGWARPVPVVASNFRDYRMGDIRVSLAGVTANFLIALVCMLLVIIAVHVGRAIPGSGPTANVVVRVLGAGISLNFLLMVFNLLPVPPLDGSHLVVHFLPPRAAAQWQRLSKYATLAFIGLLLTGWIRYPLWPAFALERVAWNVIGWLT